MELQQISKTVSKKIEKAYINDLELIINTICNEYDIRCRHTQTPITKNILLQKFMWKPDKVCQGITKQGNVCTKKPIKDSDYCTNHLRNLKLQEQMNCVVNVVENKQSLDSNLTLETIQVDNCFYLLDHTSGIIYDRDNMTKVGYTDSENNKYIITSDPFLLEALS